MSLLPCLATSYQARPAFAQENPVLPPVFGSDVTTEASFADLPDAPGFARKPSESSNFAAPESTAAVSVAPPKRPLVPLNECPYDETKARECRVHWRQLLISSAMFLTWQNTANAYSSYWYRHETMSGKWWDRYVNSVTGYKFTVWSDGNPLMDDYVGHPLMGSITNALWIQNDPKDRKSVV